MTLTSRTPLLSNWDFLQDEFSVLKLQLTRELHRQRLQPAVKQIDQLQGLVLTEQEILDILAGGDGPPRSSASDLEREIARIEHQVHGRRTEHGNRAWLHPVHLAESFGLSRMEEQCLLLCLAAETDARYGKVFAFLQDDVLNRQPSVGLALRLFAGTGEDSIVARSIFHPSASLAAYRMLQFADSTAAAPLTSRFLKLDDRIAGYLLGVEEIDPKLAGWVELLRFGDGPIRTPVPEDVRRCAVDLLEAAYGEGKAQCRPVLHLYGSPGSGRRSLAEHVCQRLHLPLLVADARQPSGSGVERADLLWRLGRESFLQPAAIFLEHFDDLLAGDRADELSAFLQAALEFAPVTFLSGSAYWRGNDALSRRMFVSIACPVPEMNARIRLWTEHLASVPHHAEPQAIIELATKFQLSDGQIQRAVGLALSKTAWAADGDGRVRPPELARACRALAAPNLRDLAQHIEPVYEWPDIVLPDNQLGQLHELAAHVTRAQTVLEAWGFARKLPYGRGVAALFEGGSGTGKTMAAQIIAGELELDLFKIDLSAVVSKYVGETEKNLGRVFAEAQSANAILFFDEADALFAKRSELTKGDAHDRYANMETAYLLQRIEDYTGVVILATNLKQNLDEAFIRRLRFIIHFPFPDEEHRLRIWQQVFPREAPVGSDVDFRWLARKLKIAGGHIKSISLRAAYQAAERRTEIDMTCIKEAARRELEKFGRTWISHDSSARPLGQADRATEAVA
jgi:AAA+ superfamily predicted ATPase